MPNFSLDHWSQEELDRTLLSFEEIQGDLNYRQAQHSLRNLVNQLDLTAEEQSGLESQIDHLTIMLDKLEQSVIQIAAFGMVGRGKSSVLNALLGQEVFQTGPLHGVTRAADRSQWQLTQETIGDTNLERVAVAGVGNAQIQLIDTPGIDEVDGETREVLARENCQTGRFNPFYCCRRLDKSRI